MDNTTRNPTLLFQLSGSFLLRYDACALSAGLIQEPPRNREQRFVGAAYLQQSANELLQRLFEAQRSASPHARLLHADVALAQMRMHWRLAHGWTLFGDAQFEHGAKLMDEVGRLLGAWLKNTKPAATPPRDMP